MSSGTERHASDPLARVLEAGVIAVVVGAPLMIGAVQPVTRLTLEIIAFLLGLVWLVRARVRPTVLPPTAVSIGVVGLLVLALIQIMPLGGSVTSILSPESVRIRESLVPSAAELANETAIVGQDPRAHDTAVTVSVDPMGTASALRTGAALAILLLVSVTVSATRGVRSLALALLLSAAFQALYGILMLVSDNPMIWHIPKRYYLESATGTFVNRNHFAGYLAASLPVGLALAISVARRSSDPHGTEDRLRPLSSNEGNRALLLGVLAMLGLAGLMLSFSRAGIALGSAALVVTAVAAGGIRSLTW